MSRITFIKIGADGQVKKTYLGRLKFDELRKDALARPADGQATDVVSLNADLLEVATEQDNHWASVRFSGMVRETPNRSASTMICAASRASAWFRP